MNPEAERIASQWLVNHRATSDPRTLSLIVERAQQLVEDLGGYLSVAHFERGYLELLNEGAISKIDVGFAKQSAAPAIPQEVIDFIESPRTSAWELQRRYNTDATFRSQYDLYERQRKVQQANSTLSVEEYRRLPAATIAKKYRIDAGFRAAVDSLISRGLI
jgi:hypothetical protein